MGCRKGGRNTGKIGREERRDAEKEGDIQENWERRNEGCRKGGRHTGK